MSLPLIGVHTLQARLVLSTTSFLLLLDDDDDETVPQHTISPDPSTFLASLLWILIFS